MSEVYERAYESDRPELFLKAVGWRAVGHNQPIRTRYDSYRSVPETELVLVLNQHLEIVGYTAGSDITARDIEYENPLYLPQAKFYDDSCALGPGIMITSPEEVEDVSVELQVQRGDAEVFSGSTDTSHMRRKLGDLLEYMGRELDFPDGALLMTGSGITLPDEFTLQPGDKVRSVVGELTLQNEVAARDSKARLSGWSHPDNGLRYRTLRR
jgi:2-dehydro-3-deoxy-D-arabinonate dehydratase